MLLVSLERLDDNMTHVFHDFGDLVVQRGTFTDKDGVITDPSEVKGSYLKPDGTEVILTEPDPNLIKIGIGIYDLQIDVDLNVTGRWSWRIFAEGTLQSADEGHFEVLQKYAQKPDNTIDSNDIANLAKAPEQVSTDEGMVRERRVDELIKADQHLANRSVTDLPLHGFRISRARPGGAV